VPAVDILGVLDVAVRALVATLLGGAIGVERQWRLRTAGIRTNALVAAGAALFTIVGSTVVEGSVGADPTRVAAQVVSGIGFLGAGVILRDGANIRGLTTAATLWCAAAIGTLAGAGLLLVAAIGSLIIVSANIFFRPLSRLIRARAGSDQPIVDDIVDPLYMLEVVTDQKNETRVRALLLQSLNGHSCTVRSMSIRTTKNSRAKLLTGLTGERSDAIGDLEVAVQRLSLEPAIVSSRWWIVEDDE